MMKNILFISIAISVVLTGVACDAETQKPVAIEKEWKGSYCGYSEAAELVVRDKKEWIGLWEKVYSVQIPLPEVPQIDFSKNMIIAVFMGQKTSGGYSIEIANIFEQKDKIIVELKERIPPPGAVVTLAITSPYHIAVVPASKLPVKFVYPLSGMEDNSY